MNGEMTKSQRSALEKMGVVERLRLRAQEHRGLLGSAKDYELFEEAAEALSSHSLGGGERIVSAAFLYLQPLSDDPRAVATIVSAPPPARHHNLFALAGIPDEDGFLTSTGRFVGREEALQIAKAAGQPMIDHPSRHARLLFSEDLW